MGVYIVKSKHCNWYKVGHFKVTAKRPNVYYRFINRGFNSCKCPQELSGKVNFEDLELIMWFPNLNSGDEHKLHAMLKKEYNNTGEWYNLTCVEKLINTIKEYGGIESMLTSDDLSQALNWR